MTDTAGGNRHLNPSEFMRARHPDLFSDSKLEIVRPLDKSLLEYHLETLTNRKQEQAFEEFCRRLAEFEVCPNLKPQTGPTGGGDSKTDTSTYPVAKVLAERIYWGSPNPPAEESWAFAFSCKKDWKSKVDDDIKKIAELERKFTKAFFISNQFISDKKQSNCESELSKEYGMEVHIFDRNWIVTRVFKDKHENLAIESLGIAIAETTKPQIGPRDIVRSRELEGLLIKLSHAEEYRGNDYSMAQDYLTAAKLSRSLEKPRSDTDHLFSQARKLAKTFGSAPQMIRTSYHHAWSSYFWFDDPTTLAEIYSEMEQYLEDAWDAEDCELFCNLWKLLYGAMRAGEIDASVGRVENRLTGLQNQLRKLSNQPYRPNNALYAETLLFLLEIPGIIEDEKKSKDVLENLRRCLKKSDGLGTYPAIYVIRILTEMGDMLGGLPGYDSLFEEMRKIAGKREGEIAEGRLLYERGLQLASGDDPRKVLFYLGLARPRLNKRETEKENIRISLACCDAYRQVGFRWAARMEAIGALHSAMRQGTANEYILEAFLSAKTLGWIELELGRVVPFISWYQISWGLLGRLRDLDYNVERFEKELRIQEGVLGCLFLNLSPGDLKQYIGLKGGLDRANLPMARWALLYANGEADAIKNEMPSEMKHWITDIDKDFAIWKSQPAAEELPSRMPGEAQLTCTYETKIMGVLYKVKTANEFGPIAFSENILGIVEAALALAKWENLAFVVDEVSMEVRIKDFGANPPPIDLNAPPNPNGYVFEWKIGMVDWLTTTGREEVSKYLLQFLLKMLIDITIDPIKDIKDEIEQWGKNETFSRALGLSPTVIPLQDMIGRKLYEISLWDGSTAS